MSASWSSITQKVVSSRSSGAGSSATRSVTCGFQTGGPWAYKETAGDIGGVGMMVQVEGVGDDADLMLPGALARFFLLNKPMLVEGREAGRHECRVQIQVPRDEEFCATTPASEEALQVGSMDVCILVMGCGKVKAVQCRVDEKAVPRYPRATPSDEPGPITERINQDCPVCTGIKIHDLTPSRGTTFRPE